MKKLGFGLMRLPLVDINDAASVDIETLKKMVDEFISRGFTYFDTAYMYCAFQSESAVKDALVSRYPRESYTLATKLHSSFINKPEDRNAVFEEQLLKTGVSYFDYYLIHGIEAESYEKYESLKCFEWLAEKKKEGLVRHIGFSFHDSAELLDKILTKHPEAEFVQLQINYLDWDSEWIQSRKCYETALKHGKKIFVMEPCKGGTLAKVPENVEKLFKNYKKDASAASWAMRYAGSLPGVEVVLSGMSNMEQLSDNISTMDSFQKLNTEETEIVEKAAEMIKSAITVPCTGCSYCTEGCPMNIPIPKYFSLYNADMQEAKDKGWRANSIYYSHLKKDFGKPSDCIACGQCEGVCPQHIKIIDMLKEVSDYYD